MNRHALVCGLILSTPVVVVGCAENEPDRVESTSPRAPLDPSADPVNAVVRQETVVALIVTLDFGGQESRVSDVRVTRVPLSMVRTGTPPGHVRIEALDANDLSVGRSSAAIRRINAVEGDVARTAIVENRQVWVAVPLIDRPTEISVSAPGLTAGSVQATYRVNVSEKIQEYCDAYPTDSLCLRPLDPLPARLQSIKKPVVL